jgi:hypothetical protein
MLRALILLIVCTASAATSADESFNTDEGMTRILVTFADAGMSSAARAGPARPGYTRRTSTYLVSVGVKRAANRIAKDFDLVTLEEWPIISLKVHCLVFGVPNDVDIEDLFARLRQRPEVESAQRLNEFEVGTRSDAVDNDPYAELQHNLVTLEVERAHIWSRGDGIEVSIIDTGADFNHPELRGRIANHQDFVESGDGEFSADAHGTAVAGVIGAESNNGVGIVGVAPLTRLSVLKACWQQPGRAHAICNTFTLAKALNFAIESETDIINLSLNGPPDPLLARMVEKAMQLGILVVAAAPEDRPSGFPVDIPGVIVVGSDDSRDAEGAASRPLINAPAADILVPVPDGGYDFASGTSLSAAQVSGVVALLVSRQPDLTASEIVALLVNSQPTGAQSVNACRALAELLTESGCAGGEPVAQLPSPQKGNERLTTN